MFDKTVEYLKRSSRWFDIYFEESTSMPIRFENNRFHSISEKESSGYGIRVNSGGKTGFSFGNNPEHAMDVAGKSIELSKYGDNEDFVLPEAAMFDSVVCKTSGKTVEPRELVERGNEVIAKMLSVFPDGSISLRINSSRGNKRIINSNGVDYRDAYTAFSYSINMLRVSADGTRTEIGDWKSDIEPMSFDGKLIEGILEKHRLAETLDTLPSGRIPVIFTPEASMALLEFVLDGLYGSSVYKKVSPFSGKIGSKEFNEKLIITDDPFVPRSLSSMNFDDEGNLPQKKMLIDKGVVANIISNLKYAKLLGVVPSANSARGYSSMPGASFSNVIVEAGQASYKDMISSVKSGIFVEEMLGLGQSNTITGDFTGNLGLAFAIKDGKIAGRVKDSMIADNIISLLKTDFTISRDVETRGGFTCPYFMFDGVNFAK